MNLPSRCGALLFDLDGTLVDSRHDIAAALNATLRSIGRDELALEAVLAMVGDGARSMIERALGSAASEDVETGLARYLDAYAAKPCVHTTLLEGARDALEIDLPRAVLTNKPRRIASLVLDALRVEVDAVFAGGDGPLKPAPDGVYALCKQLHVPVAETWLVGDGPQDVLAGRAAGCFTVAVLGTIADHERVLAAKPDLVLGSLADLAAAVARRA